jgi:cytoskeletal protein RodZ
LQPVRFLIALAASAVLALPATALAQGAGDEQYSDPFGTEQGQQQEATPQPTPAPATPAPSTPAPAQSPQSPSAPAPAQAPAPSAAQLPITGPDAGLVALAGALLLGGGVGLRLRLARHG